MNESLDQTKHDNHRRNVVNVFCDRNSRNENTSRSSTPVSMQQMVTGQMTVETMDNNNTSSNRVVIQSSIDQRPVVVDQINVNTVVNQSMIDSRPLVLDEINVGSSDTVVIDSDFKLFAIDYFKSGKISFLISH